MMDVATYGVGLFTPVILGAMHFDSARSGTVAAVLGDAEGSGLVDLFLLAGFIVGIWAVPRFGRIPLQVTGFAGIALGMLLLMFAAMAGDGPQGHLGLIIAGFVLFNFAMNAGRTPQRSRCLRCFPDGDPRVREQFRGVSVRRSNFSGSSTAGNGD
jgi:hypothetical protein